MAGDRKTDENNEVKNEPTEEMEEKNPSYSSDSNSESEDEVSLVQPRESRDSRNAADNIRDFMNVINSKRIQRRMEEDERASLLENELFEFPKDPEKWKEEDLKELWADPPAGNSKTGWDPNLADKEDISTVRREIKAGRDPLIGPFYIPYRKPYPAIPDNHYDISNPKGVIEELDRIEEFLRWVSYVFEDHSSYEGTVWDDKAHGKGVFVGEKGLVRYEGEWLHNEMEGHGVVEVEIPYMQPIPGSKLEKKMRAQGRIINRDFMTPEDREWLEMDIEDSIAFTDGHYETPFYERKEWKLLFGKKPEKGLYRYAGQWKHGRMHGCGVYKVNERTIYGRFYFGEFVERDTYGCDLEISAMHSGLAEVAAAKARMFTNKPDGMVREERGPYGDPQHPYFYEEDDVWMAPGFINQFYEVPDYWKMYVHEVDQERELWLNSFYKAPLRLPMPAELEYWWANDEEPEFALINKEPEPDPEDPSKLIYTEDPLIMHVPSGRIIDYVDDEEHGIRLFWAPDDKEGDVGPDTEAGEEEIEFLPLGFDEFYGRNADVVEEDHFLKSLVLSVEKAFEPLLSKLEKWAEEKKKDVEMKMELIKKEHELAEAESALNEAVDELDSALKMMQEMEEKKAAEMGIHEEDEEEEDDGSQSKQPNKFEKKREEDYKEEDEEEEGGEGDASSFSFGSVENQEKGQDDQKNGNREGGKSPFGASSLPFAACFLASQVPCKLQHSFMTWKEGKARQQPSSTTALHFNGQWTPNSVAFPNATAKSCRLRAARDVHYHGKLPMIVKSKHAIRFKKNASQEIQEEESSFSILSLHTPLAA
ncbi:unnamed protein product [Cuscuta campestris]|uniref:MORN repeat-containing protein n=1 Tax=Cuscuta campestris TaxID=132261 RepID=A0A484L5G8_9ASTE|nr:unnamed protein product [Cuscuta campestris]